MSIQLCRIGRPAVRRVMFVALAALLPALVGCAVPIKMAALDKKIPGQIVPLLVDASLDKMGDPLTQRRIQELMASPQLHAIERDLVGGLVDSSMTALSDKERAERIGALATKAMTGIVQGAMSELGPAMAQATSGAMNGALDAAFSPAHQRALENLVGGLVASTLRAVTSELQHTDLGKNMASAITDQLGPALGKALREEVAKGLAEVLKNEELKRELGATARMLAKEMVIGATEALAQTQQPRAADGSLLSRVTELAHEGARLFGSAAWLLLLIIVALVVWTVKLLSQSRRYREEADRRAATSRLLSEATKAAEGKPWSDELIGVLKERLSAEEEEIAQLRWAKRGRPAKNGHSAPGNGHSGAPHA